jgi:hypothetical protein
VTTHAPRGTGAVVEVEVTRLASFGPTEAEAIRTNGNRAAATALAVNKELGGLSLGKMASAPPSKSS